MHKNISISLILLISLFSFSGCSTVTKASNAIGKALYTPVYEEQVVGEKVTEVVDEVTGEVLSTKKDDIIERVIVRYEPNALGKLLETGADLIPIPGASTATSGLLGAGGIALLAMERLRRKEKKGKVEMEDKFHIAVGGIKEFMKTEEGEVATKALKKALKAKAGEFGMSKEFKTAVNIAKAVL